VGAGIAPTSPNMAAASRLLAPSFFLFRFDLITCNIVQIGTSTYATFGIRYEQPRHVMHVAILSMSISVKLTDLRVQKLWHLILHCKRTVSESDRIYLQGKRKELLHGNLEPREDIYRP
jgi:hypothetical protein